MKIKKRILAGILSLIMILCTACQGVGKTTTKEINKEPNASKMRAICELATMQCYYHNVAKYTEENASGWWLWSKDMRFWVEYSGVVTMGIDATKLQVNIVDDQVEITIPSARVLGAKVDEESLTQDSFYIEKNSAKVEAEQQTEAFKQAQGDMEKKAENDTALLANAQQRAQSLLEDYVKNLGEAVGKEYKITWKYVEDTDASDADGEDADTTETDTATEADALVEEP